MTFELDPDKRLYVPGRRRFLFLSGLAMAGTVVKGLAQEPARVAETLLPVRGHLEFCGRTFAVIGRNFVEILPNNGGTFEVRGVVPDDASPATIEGIHVGAYPYSVHVSSAGERFSYDLQGGSFYWHAPPFIG